MVCTEIVDLVLWWPPLLLCLGATLLLSAGSAAALSFCLLVLLLVAAAAAVGIFCLVSIPYTIYYHPGVIQFCSRAVASSLIVLVSGIIGTIALSAAVWRIYVKRNLYLPSVSKEKKKLYNCCAAC